MRYRKNLAGDAAFNSFVPTLLSDVQVEHTARLDTAIVAADEALRELNSRAAQWTDEQVARLMNREAEASCELALGRQRVGFGFVATACDDTELDTDTSNLLDATAYALRSMDRLPLTGRLLKDVHYLMCRGESYERRYPGEFRSSPVWIGWKDSTLRDALFVPPTDDDMVEAIADLERYINSPSTEHVLVRAALIHYQFEMIHPFVDANGRVGRLLNTLFLIEQSVLARPVLQLSTALARHAIPYYKELQRVNETGDCEPWLCFFADRLCEAARRTIA